MGDLIPVLLAFLVSLGAGVWLLASIRRALAEDEADRYLRESDYDPTIWAKREFPTRSRETLPESKVIRSIPWRGRK